MSHVVDAPGAPDDERPRPEAWPGIDVAAGIVGEIVGAGLTLRDRAARLPPLRLVWRPPLVPARLQPAAVVDELRRRGEQHRIVSFRLLVRLVDEIVEAVDLDRVVARVDVAGLVEEVLAEIDLPALVRESTGTLTSDAVRQARMRGIQADDALSRGLDRLRGRTTGAP